MGSLTPNLLSMGSLRAMARRTTIREGSVSRSPFLFDLDESCQC
jgi:hypothetical protein